MSDYIEYNDKVAFHPGYYIRELIDESGLTQQDFAYRLGTTPKNLSLLIRGEQSLSLDIAMKLSRLTGTSINYWLNLQSSYDSLVGQFKTEEELERERQIFRYLEYRYFKDHFGLPDLPRKTDEQIKAVREFLKVSTLSVFTKPNTAVSFRSAGDNLSEANVVKANIMVQLAMNETLETRAPKFNKRQFERAVSYALTLTRDHEDFYPLIRESFLEAGVVFVILPNMRGSRTNGATKRVGDHVMLMVNDRRLYSDTFWFTLFHEIGHIMNDDYGISFEQETGEQEEAADRYAEDQLIPSDSYRDFVENRVYTAQSIRHFADLVNRDPGIIVGRLQKDGLIGYNNRSINALRHQYKVEIETSL